MRGGPSGPLRSSINRSAIPIRNTRICFPSFTFSFIPIRIVSFIKSEELADDGKIILLENLIQTEQTDELQADQDAEILDKEISTVSQQQEYYDIIEGNFRKLNNRVGRLLQLIVFDRQTSVPLIFEAWQH